MLDLCTYCGDKLLSSVEQETTVCNVCWMVEYAAEETVIHEYNEEFALDEDEKIPL